MSTKLPRAIVESCFMSMPARDRSTPGSMSQFLRYIHIPSSPAPMSLDLPKPAGQGESTSMKVKPSFSMARRIAFSSCRTCSDVQRATNTAPREAARCGRLKAGSVLPRGVGVERAPGGGGGGVGEGVPADGEQVAVAAEHGHMQLRVRQLQACRERDGPAVGGVERVHLQVAGDATGAADAGDDNVLVGGDGRLRHGVC